MMATAIPTNSLGRTGLEVTSLGFGAYELRGAPTGRDISPKQAAEILNGVLDSGINFIDTSIDYGMSEEYIGQFISNRRDEYYLGSKCGCVPDLVSQSTGSPMPHDYTKRNIVAGVEHSLRSMKTDYLDVVQFHGSPSREVLETNESVEALIDLQVQGKIRHLGMSGTLPNLKDQIAMDIFDVFQIPYSALYRQHESLISLAASVGAGTVIRGGVAQGAPERSGAPRIEAWELFDRAGLQELLEVGEQRTDFILRFTLSHPDLHTTIVGTANIDHILENVSTVMKGPLPPDVYEEAKARLNQLLD